MTDAEIIELVDRHLRGSLDLSQPDKGRHHLTSLNREVDSIAARLPEGDAEDFKKRCHAAVDYWCANASRALDGLPARALHDLSEPNLEERFAKHFRMAIPAIDAGADVGEAYDAGLNIVFDSSANMEQPARRDFVTRWMNRYSELWEEFSSNEAVFRERHGIIPRQPLRINQEPRRPRPLAGSGYVGRTVVRAVVWNAVNSVFRVFR